METLINPIVPGILLGMITTDDRVILEISLAALAEYTRNTRIDFYVVLELRARKNKALWAQYPQDGIWSQGIGNRETLKKWSAAWRPLTRGVSVRLLESSVVIRACLRCSFRQSTLETLTFRFMKSSVVDSCGGSYNSDCVYSGKVTQLSKKIRTGAWTCLWKPLIRVPLGIC
jgi:hypothetical protein